MKGYWKKRTLNEMAESQNNGDNTGGYKFLPWLLYMNKGFTFGALPIALTILIAGIVEKSDLTIGVMLGLLILYTGLMFDDYKKSKKGVNRTLNK